MSDFVIYHNPRCSKSRQTLQLLRDQDVEPAIVEYMTERLSKAAIKKLVKLLGIDATALVRKADLKKLQLEFPGTQAAAVELMAEYPQLIERPIVVARDQARLGRPPENVLDLIP